MSQAVDLSSAREYFLDKLEGTSDEDLNPTIEDSDGLVSYIYGTTNTPPPELVKDIEEIGSILQSLVGIVTGAVLNTSRGDSKKLHDFATWWEPFAVIGEAFFAQFSNVEQKENKQVTGVGVATEFIGLILDSVVSQGAAMDNFRKFLSSQGETMRLQVENDGSGYKYASLGIAHEVFQLPDEKWVYVPKIRCYWTEFSAATFKLTSSCVSVDHFQFDFTAKRVVGVFPYETWKNDPDFRKEVTDFIKDVRGAKINESKNYFKDKFAATPKS